MNNPIVNINKPFTTLQHNRKFTAVSQKKKCESYSRQRFDIRLTSPRDRCDEYLLRTEMRNQTNRTYINIPTMQVLIIYTTMSISNQIEMVYTLNRVIITHWTPREMEWNDPITSRYHGNTAEKIFQLVIQQLDLATR